MIRDNIITFTKIFDDKIFTIIVNQIIRSFEMMNQYEFNLFLSYCHPIISLCLFHRDTILPKALCVG